MEELGGFPLKEIDQYFRAREFKEGKGRFLSLSRDGTVEGIITPTATVGLDVQEGEVFNITLNGHDISILKKETRVFVSNCGYFENKGEITAFSVYENGKWHDLDPMRNKQGKYFNPPGPIAESLDSNEIQLYSVNGVDVEQLQKRFRQCFLGIFLSSIALLLVVGFLSYFVLSGWSPKPPKQNIESLTKPMGQKPVEITDPIANFSEHISNDNEPIPTSNSEKKAPRIVSF